MIAAKLKLSTPFFDKVLIQGTIMPHIAPFTYRIKNNQLPGAFFEFDGKWVFLIPPEADIIEVNELVKPDISVRS